MFGMPNYFLWLHQLRKNNNVCNKNLLWLKQIIIDAATKHEMEC